MASRQTASTPSSAERVPARERLLAAAESLFYEEGFNMVGIERVIERAGVAKASLYDCFGSKEELVRAYLEARKDAWQARIQAGLARCDTPRARILAIYDLLGEQIAQPNYRGCAFARAGNEARDDSSVRGVCDDSRRWRRELLVRLSREAGAADPEMLAQQLAMLYDGAAISGQLDQVRDAATSARAVAAALLDAATAATTATAPRPMA
jgi:AcrR family transcriptional regulator